MPLSQPTSDSSSTTPSGADESTTPGQVNETFYLLHDACVIDLGTLPGIGIPGSETMRPEKALGKTAVHEIGHWMGLLHVFYPEVGSCVGGGDLVSDTPTQSTPSWGCPKAGEKDSCPLAEGSDSVNNFMDYVDDDCMVEFTRGQGERMKRVWKGYRENRGVVKLVGVE